MSDAHFLTVAPMEQHNRLLMEQISTQLRTGLAAALRCSGSGSGSGSGSRDYCVVRNRGTGVLSVLAARAEEGASKPVHGPAPFAECIGFVNSSVVTRMAESDGWTPAPPPETHEGDAP